LDGSISKFEQEYGNNFLGSSETLINGEVIKKIRESFKYHKVPKEIQLHEEFNQTKVNIYEPPFKNHAYIIGADPAMGTESDYHAMCIWDITNTFDIKQVASFYQNSVPPKIFAYILTKMALLYNSAYIAIENNGCSQVVLDAVWRDFDYDNIIHEGGNPKTNIGIHSQNARKTQACLNFKWIIEDSKRKVQFNDGALIAEMEKFERKSRQGKLPTYEAADGHDDYMMAAIWGLFILNVEILERYYDIKKSIVNNLGEQIPLFVQPYEYENNGNNINSIIKLDDKMSLFGNEYEKMINKMNDDINPEFMNQFIERNKFNEFIEEIPEDDTSNRNNIDSDDAFHFGMFM
jgi:hypothetical protein